jgi:flavin-dependent dehydrogenase
MKAVSSVVIVGGGPAGSALAIHLRRAGKTVAIFDPGQRPPLLVGESLVPALVPLLKELGVEDAVRVVSTHKPGATFYTTPEKEISFLFQRAGRGSPTYAYNVPRDTFDAILLEKAVQEGALLIARRAGFRPGVTALDDHSPAALLDDETLQAWRTATGVESPDLVVDASGRSRALAKLFKLPSWEGDRKDVAIFAHLPSVEAPHQGHIHINRLRHGWSWRIPLPDRVSVGIVISRDALRQYGDSAEEQYERLCREEPVLRGYIRNAERLTPVMKYTNYQMASHTWTGSSWALLGDAGGFIDPIFSSGLLLALEGARELASAITKGWRSHACKYERTMRRKLSCWRSLIGAFYDGRVFSLFRLRDIYANSRSIRVIIAKVDQQLALALSGAAPTSRRRLWLLNGLLWALGRSKTSPRVRIA